MDLIFYIFQLACLTESPFSSHEDEYPEHEQAYLRQLFTKQRCLPISAMSSCNNAVLKVYPCHAMPIFSMHYICHCHSDAGIACWKPADNIWIIWDNWVFYRSFSSIFAPASNYLVLLWQSLLVGMNEQAISRCSLFSSQVIFQLQLMFHFNINDSLIFNFSQTRLV